MPLSSIYDHTIAEIISIQRFSPYLNLNPQEDNKIRDLRMAKKHNFLEIQESGKD